MSKKDGGKGMQLLGVLVLMGLGWALFEGDPLLIGWVFVGALLLQIASTSKRLGRRFGGRRRGFSFPIFGRGRSRRGTSSPSSSHSRGGYSAPSAARGPRTWARPGAPATPAARAFTPTPR